MPTTTWTWHPVLLHHAWFLLILLQGILSTRETLAQIPTLHSYPYAPKKIFLDFRGTTSAPDDWNAWTNTSVNGQLTVVMETLTNDDPIPAFTSSNYSWIGSSQTQIITDIWSIVADRYAMFNVDVTTDPPTTQDEANDNFIRVVFDDDPTGWGLSEALPGRASRYPNPLAGVLGNYFNDPQPLEDAPPKSSREAYVFVNVFTSELGTANARRALAAGAIHEAGHMFGARHDATTTGHLVGSLMETLVAVSKDRIGWSGVITYTQEGPIINYPLWNHDAITTALGLRAGDQSSQMIYGEPMGLGSWSYFSGTHVIHTHEDVDWFAFTVDQNDYVTIKVSPLLTGTENGKYYHCVDTKIGLYDEYGTPWQTANPSGENWAGWTPTITNAWVTAGSIWYIKVESEKNDRTSTTEHGELGQYKLEAWR